MFWQIVISGPAFTVGFGKYVTVIVWVTKPEQGTKLVAWSVNVIIPVSFTPGVYLGCNVLIVKGSIVPVPFSDHK